ncbi:MAG: ABC transporter substrate-binding protein [Gemmatimonadetes bacterium]|nr:ABC transporter substrate-binding protein [Gemmatimonadota bacterium]MYI62779.1 ABC transporter substrate-binding protein [Gemmatimonadota bacterium]
MKTLWCAAWVALCIAAASAAAEDDDPIVFLKSHDAEVQAILAEAPADSLPPAVREEIKQHINAAFDFRELSRLALGDHWEERSPDERDYFVETFSSIIREQNFDSFSRYYREGDIRYESAEVQEDAAVVQALAPVRDEEIEIEYRLHRVEGVWRIYDLVIDGVSTAEGNRRRYARYIEKNGYEKLIAQLDKQLTRLREAVLSPPSGGETED